MQDIFYTFELTDKKPIGKDIYSCEFTVVGDDTFEWRPGQHVMLSIPHEGVMVDRPFSIASHPKHSPRFTIIVKMLERGVASDFFRVAEIGHQLSGIGPRGEFMVKRNDVPAVFIASGAGIGPLYAMLQDFLHPTDPGSEAHLLFYKFDGDYVDLEGEINGLTKTRTNLNFNVITNEVPCTTIVQRSILPSTTHFYLCGGDKFIGDMTGQLVAEGFDLDSIFYDTSFRRGIPLR